LERNKNYSLEILDMVQSQDDKKELLTTFISESESCIKALYEEIEDQNLKQISFYIHKLKTNLKLFKIRELYKTIGILEIKIESLSMLEIKELVNKINDVFSSVKRDIEESISL
jgi:HPt (histidine-containing phosphotransfer) domain-containing protein